MVSHQHTCNMFERWAVSAFFECLFLPSFCSARARVYFAVAMISLRVRIVQFAMVNTVIRGELRIFTEGLGGGASETSQSPGRRQMQPRRELFAEECTVVRALRPRFSLCLRVLRFAPRHDADDSL